ncbi:MAG: methylenetetrahydrofolate--tRNA-(uracil(54)-C(5))-methyltransferase (FADH(2)-oxidizing) TrmFO [Peptococcaceae bacterium]|nr:methylenetetrahydrofolate--tRNA-(uracil(54)-C(5))-methyltransferase (FADH(2)-oxidizing) TrmFO [Peptococcaceae bacterium]
MTKNNPVIVIGAGLAGAEAAWQIAEGGVPVTLYEMRPQVQTAVHRTDGFAELVCSNSLRSNQLDSAPGLLKEELRRAHSLIMASADANEVPAGGAQAVNRETFSQAITEKINTHPLITVVHEEVKEIPADQIVVCASGPLTSNDLFEYIKTLTGEDTLYFYDAAAPIITLESVDMSKAFWQSRYDKGDSADYLNCPMNREEYNHFYKTLMEAEWVPTQDYEKEIFFEGCMPVETMAKRGEKTLLFGPMKPVGLVDPHTGETPYAVVQLRKEDLQGQLMNLVGFQTRTKWGDQKKVIQSIPALANAEIVRYGVMHRNTFMNGPQLLLGTGQLKSQPQIFFAGQMTGVEGYIESAASGLVAGINAARLAKGETPLLLPAETAMGALMHHISTSPSHHFQPMNINFGLFPAPEKRIRSKKERNAYYSMRALAALDQWMVDNHV